MQLELGIKNTDLSGVLKSYVERRLRFALSRFGGQVGRVVVTVAEIVDINEGFLKICYIRLDVKPFGQIAARETSLDLYTAINRAAGRIGHLLAARLSRDNNETSPTPASVSAAKKKKEAHLSAKRSGRLTQERLPKRSLPKSPGNRSGHVDTADFASSKSAYTRRK